VVRHFKHTTNNTLTHPPVWRPRPSPQCPGAATAPPSCACRSALQTNNKQHPHSPSCLATSSQSTVPRRSDCTALLRLSFGTTNKQQTTPSLTLLSGDLVPVHSAQAQRLHRPLALVVRHYKQTT